MLFFTFNGTRAADRDMDENATSSTSSDIAVLPEPTFRDRLACFRIPHSPHCPKVVTCHFIPGERQSKGRDCGCKLVSLGIDIVTLRGILLDCHFKYCLIILHPPHGNVLDPIYVLRRCNPLDLTGRLSTIPLASAMLSVALESSLENL